MTTKKTKAVAKPPESDSSHTTKQPIEGEKTMRPSNPIPETIRRRINVTAHRLALDYEYRARDELMARLADKAVAGATETELADTLRQIEGQRLQFL